MHLCIFGHLQGEGKTKVKGATDVTCRAMEYNDDDDDGGGGSVGDEKRYLAKRTV